RGARDGRRRVGMDGERVRRLPRLPGAPVSRVLAGVLRQRLPLAARRLVGDEPASRHSDVSKLGPTDPPADLRRRAHSEGRDMTLPTETSGTATRIRVDSYLG